MTQEEFARRVLDAMKELGAFTDAQGVADFLLREGCKGEPTWPCTCPIARFITKRIDPDVGSLLVVTVGSDSLTAMDFRGSANKGGDPALSAWIGFEQPVKDFIHAFDHEGRYPELVEA